ncbi:MAG TPA: enoyl-CoA hydratase [Candidatus Binataceae bacterium]|nr:enoyl-CoA hydratase [Candidatus Binataceae bacterium]
MPEQELLVQNRDGVLYLTLNRPDKLNALSETIISGLLDNLRKAAVDDGVGAVVVTGAGRGFCAGGDIGRMRDRNENIPSGGNHSTSLDQRIAGLRRSEEVSLLLHEIPKVTIAAINGPAAGAGFSISLACDIRLASDQARVGSAFARVGYSGDFGGTYFLTKIVGTAKARELYFTADMLSADEALKEGIVNRVFPAASFAEDVHAFARRIASGPRIAYSYMKANLNAAACTDARTLLEREALGQSLTGLTDDHKEAVKAFLEKREPRFRGH